VPGRPNQNDRRSWWGVFGLLVLVGTLWAVATPPVTGPDEVEQARRAAAVVRGDLIGARQPDVPPLVVDVRVPQTYGEASVDHWRCFLGPLVDGSPQQAMPLPPSTCPELSSSRSITTVQTVQYRGQPFFYAWVGLGTLWPGPFGTYLMRFLSILPVAALLATAAVSARRTGRGRLAGLAVACVITPMVMYLAGSTNPSALEVAAAACAWTTGMVLADRRATPSGRTVASFGVALVVLSLTRGLGPLFSGYLVVAVAAVAGWRRIVELAKRRDLQIWAGAVVVAVGLSGAWLAHLQSDYALPPRPGTGWHHALDYLPWYLRQTVGVFGTNDSALSSPVSTIWVAAAGGVLVAGLWRSSWAARAVALATLVVGLAMQVTAEGLSLPPIGFFWQGRYALPILVGAVLVSAVSPRRPSPDQDSEPVRGPLSNELGLAAELAVWAIGGVLVVVQTAAFLTVLRHYTAEGPGSLRLSDAVFHPTWAPPLWPLVLVVAYVGAIGSTVVLLLRSTDHRPVGSAPVLSVPEEPLVSTPT